MKYQLPLHTLLLFVFLLSASTAFADVDLFAPRAFDGGVGFATGDFDGDGKLDVVAAKADSITMLKGDGTGKFPLLATPYQCTNFTSTAIKQPLVGDFNGDGRLDIAAWIDDGGCRGARAVVVLPGQGNGRFGTPIFTEVSNFVFTPNQFASADFNGDGKPDLAVAVAFSSSFDRVGILINNGNGTFAAPVEYNFTGSQSGFNMTVGDVTGDNRPDILYGSRSPENVMLMVNSGTGTFGAPVVAVPGVNTLIGAGRFDSGTTLDLVTSGTFGANATVRAWLGNGSGGFTGASPLTLSIENAGIGRALAIDTNNDGTQDIAIQSEARVVVATSVGGGAFTEDAAYSTGGGAMFDGDFNNDGFADIGVTQALATNGSPNGASNEFAVMLNIGGALYLVAPSFETGFGGDEIALADMNNDGLRDVIFTGDAANGEIVVLLQDTSRPLAKGGGKRMGLSARGGSSVSPKALAIGDFNGDNKPDVVAAGKKANGGNDNVIIGTNNGTGDLTLSSSFSLPGEVTKVVAAKINNDNILDLAFAEKFDTGSPTSAVYVAIGNGNGTFQTPVAYLANSQANGIAAADLNGDSRAELAVGLSTGTVAILVNNGSGGFSAGATYDVGGGLPVTDIAFGNINSDAKSDIVATTSAGFLFNTAKVNVLYGSGNATFSSFAGFPTVGSYTQRLVLADIDGDGKTDVVTTNNGVFSVLRNTGSGFSRSMWATTGGLLNVAAGDLDNDGKIDLVTSSAYNAYRSLSVVANVSTPTLVQRRAAFDYDGDGKTDISVYRPSNNAWYLNRSTAGFTAYGFGQAGDVLVPADYTGDGKSDVCIWRPSNGQWFVLRSEDLTFYAAPFGTNGDIVAPGDYDGDGKADLAVFRPGAQGTFYIQRTTAGDTAVQFGIAEDKPVQGDYDGDGKTDIAVFRPSDRGWYRYNSSNGAFVAIQFGLTGDKVVPADYTGDGKTDIAVWRELSGIWFILRSEDQTFFGVPFGTTGDIPTPGDFDGDGKTDFAIYRSSQGTFYVQATTQGFFAQQFGLSGDRPTPNSFVY